MRETLKVGRLQSKLHGDIWTPVVCGSKTRLTEMYDLSPEMTHTTSTGVKSKLRTPLILTSKRFSTLENF